MGRRGADGARGRRVRLVYDGRIRTRRAAAPPSAPQSSRLPLLGVRMSFIADVGNYSYGRAHPMQPHRARIAHTLMANYELLGHVHVQVRRLGGLGRPVSSGLYGVTLVG